MQPLENKSSCLYKFWQTIIYVPLTSYEFPGYKDYLRILTIKILLLNWSHKLFK